MHVAVQAWAVEPCHSLERPSSQGDSTAERASCREPAAGTCLAGQVRIQRRCQVGAFGVLLKGDIAAELHLEGDHLQAAYLT